MIFGLTGVGASTRATLQDAKGEDGKPQAHQTFDLGLLLLTRRAPVCVCVCVCMHTSDLSDATEIASALAVG